MPKLTREELFSKSLKEFLEDITVYTSPYEQTKYSILHYTLKCVTKNKNKRTHEYELTIPSSIICAYSDRTTREGDGEELWLDSEPIYGEQSAPILCDFNDSFNKYFEPYWLMTDSVPMSYVSIIDLPRIQNIQVCDIILKIEVVYHKSHTPFPRPLTIIEEKNREIKYLEYKLRRKDNRNRCLAERIEINYDRAEYNYKRMQHKFRSMYTETGKLEPCPVCYDDISPDKLIIPNCFHYICEGCVMKCNKCPLCRDDYDEYIEEETK